MTVYSCGLRLQEGLCLEVSDIDGQRKMIHVHRGKGAKDRYVPLPEATLDLLRKYWRTHRNPKLIGSIDPAVWKIDWNVNSQAVGDGESTYKYLAPYIFRMAISDSRIVNVKEGEVTFSYRKKESNRPRQITVGAIEFIRRFLQHVLPAGFMKVRYYGFMSSSCPLPRAKLRSMILSVLAALQGEKVSLTDLASAKDAKAPRPKPKCRLCGGGLLYLFSLIPGRPCQGSI